MEFKEPPQFEPTPQEIEEAEKEIYMKGRAMRVNETSEQYRAEREKSWEEKKQAQDKKDQTKLEKVRSEIATETGQKDIEKSKKIWETNAEKIYDRAELLSGKKWYKEASPEEIKEQNYLTYINSVIEQGMPFNEVINHANERIEENNKNAETQAKGAVFLNDRLIKDRLESDEITEQDPEYQNLLQKEIKRLREDFFDNSAYENATDFIQKLNLSEDELNYSPRDEYENQKKDAIAFAESIKDKLKYKKDLRFLSGVKDGNKFDSHGIAKGSIKDQAVFLVNLLKNGLNPFKKFDTAGYDEKDNIYAAGGAYKDGTFVLLSEKGEDLVKDKQLAARTVLVSENAYDIIPDLQKEFSEINFVRADELEDFFENYDNKK